MQTTEEKVGYALGRQIGGDFVAQEINVDVNTFLTDSKAHFTKKIAK